MFNHSFLLSRDGPELMLTGKNNTSAGYEQHL